MLKSRTGTDRSDQITTWTRIAVAEALLTENSVVNPFGLLRSTSKYGSSNVAAGTASTVQITAAAGAAASTNPAITRPRARRAMSRPPFELRRPEGPAHRANCWIPERSCWHSIIRVEAGRQAGRATAPRPAAWHSPGIAWHRGWA